MQPPFKLKKTPRELGEPDGEPKRQGNPRLRAVMQALLVTFLWSTSWVLIKIGLVDLPPLTFAGLRYCLAFLILLVPFGRSADRRGLLRLPAQSWIRLLTLGVLFYAVTQGAQFVGLAFLPAVTVNLGLSLTSVVVAMLGLAFLRERPGAAQWVGITLSVGGAVLYFYPAWDPSGQAPGYAAVAIGLLANGGSAILGRAVNRRGDLEPLTVTVVSMGIGAAVLLAAGITTQGVPPLRPFHWIILGWLAVVNTAFAFTLWNRSLRVLSAVESSVINNSMMVQIPILAVVFLGERLTLLEITGLVVVALGVLLVQWRPLNLTG